MQEEVLKLLLENATATNDLDKIAANLFIVPIAYTIAVKLLNTPKEFIKKLIFK